MREGGRLLRVRIQIQIQQGLARVPGGKVADQGPDPARAAQDPDPGPPALPDSS